MLMLRSIKRLVAITAPFVSRPETESPTIRGAGGSDFSAIGGKIQRHGSALIGENNAVEPWILVQSTRFENTQSQKWRVSGQSSGKV